MAALLTIIAWIAFASFIAAIIFAALRGKAKVSDDLAHGDWPAIPSGFTPFHSTPNSPEDQLDHGA